MVTCLIAALLRTMTSGTPTALLISAVLWSWSPPTGDIEYLICARGRSSSCMAWLAEELRALVLVTSAVRHWHYKLKYTHVCLFAGQDIQGKLQVDVVGG